MVPARPGDAGGPGDRGGGVEPDPRGGRYRSPEHQRAVLLLREQEDMSYRQIARVLDISEAKVKVDLFRARTAARARWRELHPETTAARKGQTV